MDRSTSSSESGRHGWRNGGRILVTIMSMVLTIWIFRMSYQLTNASRNEFEVEGLEEIFVLYGVVVVIFGMVYFIYGLTIVIELGLELFAWLQGMNVDVDVENCKNQEKEEKTICKLCAQATATIVSMSMLGWAIYHGCKLTTTTPEGRIRNCILFLVGFTGMALGFICFIFGIPFVAEPALSLYDQFLQIVTQNEIHEEKITDPLLAV